MIIQTVQPSALESNILQHPITFKLSIAMSLRLVLAALAAVTPLALAAPATDNSIRAQANLRLIKTSETDAGSWVTQQEKFDLYTSKGVGFIDITDIKDPEFLEALSTLPEDTASLLAAQFPTSLSHVEEAKGLIAKSSTTAPKTWMDKMTSFNNRNANSRTGTEAATWLFGEVKKVAAANKAITVEQFKHRFNQPSVIARLPGKTDELGKSSDPQTCTSFALIPAPVIIGAHMDSTTGSASGKAPGADDDASGSVTILEALRVLAESGFAPENTLEFHWYGGEEEGLLGSADVFRKYKADSKNVISYLNQDMTGYSPSGTPALITDYTNAALNDYMTLIITEFTGKAPNRGKCGYACSDHASATANGFPSAFAFEDLMDKTSPHVHTLKDTPANLQWNAIERHIKLSLGYLVEASYI